MLLKAAAIQKVPAVQLDRTAVQIVQQLKQQLRNKTIHITTVVGKVRIVAKVLPLAVKSQSQKRCSVIWKNISTNKTETCIIYWAGASSPDLFLRSSLE